MRVVPLIVVLGALCACAPQVPDSGQDYFDNSEDARRARDIALAGTPPPPIAVPAGQISQETTGEPLTALPPPAPVQTTPGTTLAANSGDIAADTQAALDATRQNSGEPPVQASATNDAPPILNNPGISDEQDFQAVSNRETIQSDANRIARNSEQFEQVAPTAVPNRPPSATPNIVSYALSTSHARGTRIHTRSGINLAARAQRACAAYASSDQAQIDFLAKGGPERDRLGLDPDGDGYACQWNPAPFRTVTN